MAEPRRRQSVSSVTLVVPCFNEQDVIPEFYRRASATAVQLQMRGITMDMLFVDAGGRVAGDPVGSPCGGDEHAAASGADADGCGAAGKISSEQGQRAADGRAEDAAVQAACALKVQRQRWRGSYRRADGFRPADQSSLLFS